MDAQLKFVEYENALFRTRGDAHHMTEVLVNGHWQPAGKLGLDAGTFGTPLDATEAEKFAGDKWPAAQAPSSPSNSK